VNDSSVLKAGAVAGFVTLRESRPSPRPEQGLPRLESTSEGAGYQLTSFELRTFIPRGSRQQQSLTFQLGRLLAHYGKVILDSSILAAPNGTQAAPVSAISNPSKLSRLRSAEFGRNTHHLYTRCAVSTYTETFNNRLEE
jgi:hypothetical protein